MTQTTYRANITAAEFPFLSELQGRTVIMPTIDQNYSRQASSPKNKDRDIGIPQMYYAHNVMPTEAGVTSISYQKFCSGPIDTDNTFTDVFYVRDPFENGLFLGITSSGRNYVLGQSGWFRTTDKAPVAGTFVTTAHVNGQTYICYPGQGCFKYDLNTASLVAVTLAGIDLTKLRGICAANGYMIAWTLITIQWSSIIDPTDFVPSLVTGAGGQGVQLAKGGIVVCLPQNTGFIVYTKKNAVAEIYTGNAQYPFSAKEVIGSGGLSTQSLVSYDGTGTNHFAYTTAGLQEISVSNSSIVFPQLTDFIAGSQFEDYEETTNVFTVLQLVVPMKKKLTVVANRYLVFSYGVSQLTHALVYDFAHSRWGKIKVNHVDCFEYTYIASEVVEAPRRNIGFLQADGTVLIAVLAYDTTGSYGTVLMGKYQLDRNHYVQMQEIHLESIKANNTLTVKLLSSIDGLNTTTTTPVLAISNNTYRRYNCRATGLNHSIAITGAFHLNSIELKFSDEGEVR